MGHLLRGGSDALLGMDHLRRGGSDPLLGTDRLIPGIHRPFPGGDDPRRGMDDSFPGMDDPFRGVDDPFLGADDRFRGANGRFHGENARFQAGNGIFAVLCHQRTCANGFWRAVIRSNGRGSRARTPRYPWPSCRRSVGEDEKALVNGARPGLHAHAKIIDRAEESVHSTPFGESKTPCLTGRVIHFHQERLKR